MYERINDGIIKRMSNKTDLQNLCSGQLIRFNIM